MSEYIVEVSTQPLTKTFTFNTGKVVIKDTCFISRAEAFKRILNECLAQGLEFRISNRLRNYELETQLESIFTQNSFVINEPCPFNG